MTGQLRNILPVGALLLILLLAGWAYWPGQDGPALLDDRSSVLVIGDLGEKPELAWDYVTGDRSGLLGRPVSMASFVLEKMYVGDSITASKRVNILLHLFNGSLVVWLLWLLFRYISVPGAEWLAVILGAAWLFSPLYVSTVLYVVQRMAMLATTFMLAALIFYIYWRERLSRGRFSAPLFILLILSILLGLFSKENAVVVVPLLLLLEALWFQFGGGSGRQVRRLRAVTLGLILFGGFATLSVLLIRHDWLVNSFYQREFNLRERLLSQARILWDYVGQLYIPDVSRMGLYHDDVVVSTSLYAPLSTFYAVLGWLGIFALATVLLCRQGGRYLVLGVAWFLVAHSVESTVLPLELYFEHRNYFPGLGLFLLCGVVFAILTRHWPQIKSPLLVYLACYVAWLAGLTSSQVEVWSSHPLLMLTQVNAHPDSFRANADMAVQMASLGEFDAAQHYSDKAFAASRGERSGDHDIRDLALACIANREVVPEQIARLGTDNPIRPFGSVTTLQTLVHLLQNDACPGFNRNAFADRMAALFLGESSPATASANIYLGLALLENALQRWQNADAYMDLFLELSPENAQGLLMKLHFITALGKVADANTVRALLLDMQAHGQLTVGEQETLSLYPEQ